MISEAEEHFLQIAGHLEGVMWLIDCRDARLLYVNPGFELIWERPAEPLFGHLESLLDTIHPEDYPRLEALLQQPEGWARFNAEYRILRPDGSERWISTHSFPIHRSGGVVDRCAGISHDITDRRQLEQERETLLRALEQTADMVMITDSHGAIEYVNAAFELATGYHRTEVIGSQPTILRSGLLDSSFYQRLWQTISNGLPFSELFINRRKDGDLYYEAKTISPVRNGGGEVTHFVATGKDVTRRLGRQEQLDKLLHHDPESGLANRALFVSWLRQALGGEHGYPRARLENVSNAVALLCIDLGLSALLGDSRREPPGEALLRTALARLQQIAGSQSGRCRLGWLGQDRVALLLELNDHCDLQPQLQQIQQQIDHQFKSAVQAAEHQLYLKPHIGIAIAPDNGDDSDTLLQHAEAAVSRIDTPTRRCNS